MTNVIRPFNNPQSLDAPSTTMNAMFTVGSHGLYEWLVTDEQFDLLQVCPDIILGKFVAVTSIDSGTLEPSAEQKAEGWKNREKIAYSPKVQSIKTLPRAGFDEWYIFESRTDLGVSHLSENIFEVPHGQGHLSVFVNYFFSLHRSEDKSLAALFWPQIERIRPESYVADHDYLNFVTVNKTLFARVHDYVKALSKELPRW